MYVDVLQTKTQVKYMKKSIICILLLSLLFCEIRTSAFAENSCHWYLKRIQGKCPLFPKEAEIIRQYDAFYIDELAYQNGNKVLYLTFDAGYENGNVEKTLDILKEASVPAAFFLLDNIILKNTDLVNRMANEGHLVCNHTKNHKDLSYADKDTIKADLSALEEIYTTETGREMAKYFRFPRGSFSTEAVKTVSELGYKTIFWSFAYDDWDNCRQPNPEKAKNKVLNNTHCGAVILLHPTSETNVKILPDLIKEWKAMGYSFGTLDQLTNKQ